MQQADDPPSLPVGTEVSAKYKGAFCEAKVSKVVRNIKVRVIYKQSGLGTGLVPDDAIKSGVLRVGSMVEVKHPDKRENVEATITKIQDCSQYTVVFDDGDITTLRRTALCLKSGRHFNESETLDQLPLTHPEHFGNPVVGGRRGRRSRQFHEDSSDDDDESDAKEVINEKEEHIGKVVCIESTDGKKKDKYKWFPGLVVSPTAQVTVRIRVKDEYLVRSFKDGRYYTVPKKEATEFTRDAAAKVDSPAVHAALEYLDKNVLPAHWDRDALFGLSNSSSEYEGEHESDSSDDEPCEEKDHFVAQLYKYMDDRGTPLNKVPSIQNRDVDLYRLFRAVQKLGGYNRVTSQNQWKAITSRLGFSPITVSVTNLVKQAYKKFLQPYEDFHRKLGCSLLMTPLNSNRSKGRSLVRANSVASPKLQEPKDIKPLVANPIASTSTSVAPVPPIPTPPSIAADESENNSESSNDDFKLKKLKPSPERKIVIEKIEEKVKEEKKEPVIKVVVKPKPEADVEITTTAAVLPISSGATVKKPLKKSLHDDKRGRRRDQDSSDKTDKSKDEFAVNVGDKLKVYYHEKKVTYEAKVIEISLVKKDAPLYLVHYTGWNNRYDEWVPRERIAENLSNNVNKKKMSHADKQRAQTEKSSSSLTSMKVHTLNKKIRGSSDSQPPRSTTPSSVASNSSRTKSPATNQKRNTRRIALRGSFNNPSDISQSESDTDSDEPVGTPKKIPHRENSVASSNQQTILSMSRHSSNSATDSGDNDVNVTSSNSGATPISSKGRDYDLNQIRSELKGFQELKSPPSDAEVEHHQTNFPTFEFSSSRDETIGLTKDDETKEELSKSSSSETDSYNDDDSQSSDKTTTLENMTEKFQQKLNAEKLIQDQADNIIPSLLASSGVEKIINDCLAEKRHETQKNKPAYVDKIRPILPKATVYTSPLASNVIPESPKLARTETKVVESPEVSKSPVASSSASIATTSKHKSSFVETKLTPIKMGKYSQNVEKQSESSLLDASSENLLESVISEPLVNLRPTIVPLITVADSGSAIQMPDVYEFKEPEPFEFEIRKSSQISHSGGPFSSVLSSDVESVKRNIWSSGDDKPLTIFQSKKKKPSPVAEISANVKQLIIEDAFSDPISLPSSSSTSSEPKPIENLFELVRKSPSVNLNINALNEELATTVQETTKALTDVMQIPEVMISPKRINRLSKTNLTFMGCPFTDTKSGVANVFELKQDAENKLANADISSDIKAELETVKNMILSESNFDMEEKPSSIADKVLKAINQKKEEDKIKELKIEENRDLAIEPKKEEDKKEIKLEIPETSLQAICKSSPLLPDISTETNIIACESKFFKEIDKIDIDDECKTEHKVDIFESLPAKNNDLSETIQKLESAIQKETAVQQFDEDSSNSTDSEQRLIIEDDYEASVNTEISSSVKILPSQIDSLLTSELPVETSITPVELANENKEFQLLPLITRIDQIPTPKPKEEISPFSSITTNQPKSTFGVFSNANLLSDAGIRPIVQSPINSNVTELSIGPQQPLEKDCNKVVTELKTIESIIVSKKEEFTTTNENPNPHTESINLLLCEETIPGSPTPIFKDNICDAKSHLHPIESDIKPVPMDIECMPTTTTPTTTLQASVCVAPQSNSEFLHAVQPNEGDKCMPTTTRQDSLSQEESGEELKKSSMDGDLSPKKRRGGRKHSEAESAGMKRRRTNMINISNLKKGNASDSDDNSDTVSQQSTSCQPISGAFNFLVQLDPALNPNQRITILHKKIQDLKKTYNMVKAELVSIDRRRKKLRRRDRERKQQQKNNC